MALTLKSAETFLAISVRDSDEAVRSGPVPGPGRVANDSKRPYVEGPRMTVHWLKIKSKDYQRQKKIEFHPRKISS
jgi:hypothetical protein